ncbi:NAD(P)-binding protein [Mycena kentingensis (nom. inval.)]|nr:NAD(P)-binding protein [Mycena kentingensis (nom. inval.)]
MTSTGTTPKLVAVVTGAAQGIGKAIALQLAADGYAVAVNDIEAKRGSLETLVEEIVAKGGAGKVVIADVSQEREVDAMVETVVEAFGGIDVFVANAGIIKSSLPVTETPVEEWDQILSVNARGTFLCYRAAGRQMVKQGRGGRIIGASSITGKQGQPNIAAYSASKWVVRGLTQAIAQELGPHGITVNAFSPGPIDTAMLFQLDLAEDNDAYAEMWKNKLPVRRLGVPNDVASLVSFLASEKSSFITGQSISVNGGMFFD